MDVNILHMSTSIEYILNMSSYVAQQIVFRQFLGALGEKVVPQRKQKPDGIRTYKQ